MHSVYGPSNVAGTFGVALLSRYPIERHITKYIDTGEGEQVALLIASVASSPPIRVAVTHLGNCGPVAETQQILDILAADPVDVVIGDFNFTPTGPDPSDAACKDANDSYQRFIAAGYQDAFRLVHPAGNEARIDHAFVKRDVNAALYVADLVSDHEPLSIDVQK
jgi:endonuclease/exonuclease/phosphatase family metal-dependent hydrolase